MEETMEVKINDEPNGREITVLLTRSQLQRAYMDSEYVAELIRDYDSSHNYSGNQSGNRDNVINTSVEQRDSEYVAELIRDYNSSHNSGNQSGNRDNIDTSEEQRAIPEPESRSLFLWNEQCIYLLLALYEENKENFGCKRHKTVYDNIAKKMKETNANYDVTGLQCQSKIISLKKTFKKILDHNSTSGNDRASWPYFDRMNELFGTTGWANPVAVASELSAHENEQSATPPETESQPKKRKFEAVFEEYRKDLIKNREERTKIKQDNFSKLLEQREKQHKEKMEILRQLLSSNRNN